MRMSQFRFLSRMKPIGREKGNPMSGTVDFKSFMYRDTREGFKFAISLQQEGAYTPKKPAGLRIRPDGWKNVTKVYYKVFDGPNCVATESFQEDGAILTECETGPIGSDGTV